MQGIQGPTGPQGEQGVQGVAGQNGKSAYTAAIETGYSGTEAQFNAALANIPEHIESTSNPHKVTATQIGAELSGTAANAVSAHNSSASAHSDIRSAVSTAQTTATNALNTANGKASTVTYTATIGTSWTASGDYFYQTITVSGILASDNPIVDINVGSDYAANALYSENLCKVISITTANNSITVVASEAVATAFPIQLKVVR